MAGFFFEDWNAFFFRATSMYRRRKNISQFFFFLSLFYPAIYYHRCITTDSDESNTPLRERTNRQRRKARKFLWTTISLLYMRYIYIYTDWYTWKKKTFLGETIFPLNLKNIRLNESLVAKKKKKKKRKKKIASYPLNNNNYDSEEKIKNLIYIPTCTSRYIKTGK